MTTAPKLTRTLPVSALVALAVSVAAAPLTLLFTGHPWRAPLLLLTLLVAAVGVVTRRWGPLGAMTAQVATLVIGLVSTFAADTALLGVVPTPATWQRGADLVGEAVHTMTTSPAPAPATPGVVFTFTAGFALCALMADALAVTWRRPLAAALPILMPFLAAVANVGHPLPVRYIVALVAVLATLLVAARPLTHPAATTGRGTPAQSATAAGITVLALLLALGTAAAIPHQPPRFLAGGLGRGPGDLGRVGFAPSPDLLTDLRATDTSPILRYRTDDPAPPPLKVATASVYRDGHWQERTTSVAPSTSPSFPPPAGLSPALTPRRHTVTVEATRLEAPYLAAPAPVVSGVVRGARWNQDPATQTLTVDTRPGDYEMTYLTFPERSGGTRLSPTDSLVREGVITPDDIDTSAATTLLLTTLAEVTASATTPAERADAIQRWLREDPRFRYSLDLPPDGGRSPIDAFLTSRTGYCVQFATTMVMMARASGIPARLATGFLPGRPDGDARVVRTDDAHAWAELYLEDLGWVRYDPTPGRAVGAPEYGPPPFTASPDPGTTRSPSQRPSARPTTGSAASATPTGTSAAPPAPPRGSAPDIPWRGLGLGVSLILLAALVLAAWPLFVALRHRRRLAAADPTGQVEEHWRELRRRLADLEVEAPATATVRRAGAFYSEALDDPEAGAAMDRIVEAVERARYASPRHRPVEGDVAGVAEDARTVLAAARGRSTRVRRLRARLFPRAVLTRSHMAIH